MWNEEASLRDYIDWALDVPMFLFKRGNEVISNTGQSFRSFMHEGFGEHRATAEDWTLHLNTLFPEVRLKRTLKDARRGFSAVRLDVRAARAVDRTHVRRDCPRRSRATDGGMDLRQMETLRATAAMQGLRAEFDGGKLAHTAERILQIARDGLERRHRLHPVTGQDETMYLNSLAELVERGWTPADRVLDGFEGQEPPRSEVLRRIRP